MQYFHNVHYEMMHIYMHSLNFENLVMFQTEENYPSKNIMMNTVIQALTEFYK